MTTKTAVIWARSTTQRDADRQVTDCWSILENQSYTVIKTFKVISNGIELSQNPEFKTLKSMVKTHSMDALAIATADRLMSNLNQLKDFIDELVKAKVELIIADGTQLSNGGQLGLFVTKKVTSPEVN
jgi:DNA invertase Pin-like site-specific DNA recombinase